MCSRQRSPDITPVSFEVSLFGDPRIEARLPAPRGLSQVTTSFIGSWCLGIHRLPLVACCYYKDARVHCEVLNIRAEARTAGHQADGAGPHRDSGHLRPKPQDPTACRGRGEVPEMFHSCCAGCTDSRTPTRLNGQCSTFRCLLGRARSSRNRAYGQVNPANGSLERR
jgi:hypothetical protein